MAEIMIKREELMRVMKTLLEGPADVVPPEAAQEALRPFLDLLSKRSKVLKTESMQRLEAVLTHKGGK